MRSVALALLLLVGCADDPKDGATLDTPPTDATDGTTDTGPEPVCDPTNEDCAPGTCFGDGPQMLPGADCLSCHVQGGLPPAEDEPDKWWSAGGTIYEDAYGSAPASGVTVTITDDVGTVVTLNSNAVGNFYTLQALVPPLSMMVERGGQTLEMVSRAPTGACNSCHACEGQAGGKLYAP